MGLCWGGGRYRTVYRSAADIWVRRARSIFLMALAAPYLEVTIELVQFNLKLNSLPDIQFLIERSIKIFIN